MGMKICKAGMDKRKKNTTLLQNDGGNERQEYYLHAAGIIWIKHTKAYKKITFKCMHAFGQILNAIYTDYEKVSAKLHFK